MGFERAPRLSQWDWTWIGICPLDVTSMEHLSRCCGGRPPLEGYKKGCRFVLLQVLFLYSHEVLSRGGRGKRPSQVTIEIIVTLDSRSGAVFRLG